MRYRVNPALEPLGGWRDWDHFAKPGVKPVYRDFIFGGDDPPAPDPQIGQAALMNAELAKEMAGVARDQLTWNKEQHAEFAPVLKKILDQQVAIGNVSQDRASEQWKHYESTFLPIERTMASEAMAEGSEAQQESEAVAARADVARQFEAGRGVAARELGRMGINPNSGRYADFMSKSSSDQALGEAGAMNTARTNARLRGIALRSGAAQFGRNMPQTGIASDSLALNAGSSAQSTAGGTMAMHNAGIQSAAPWYGGAVGANQSAGNMLTNVFDARMRGYQADQSATAGLYSGLGTLGGMYMMKARRGGIIKRHGVKRKGYAAGGIVKGPGDGTVDTVPAVVDGVQPAALANGEGVLNKEAVDIVGEEFVHNVNRAALILKKGVANV